MKVWNRKYRCAAGILALLLLCGCRRVQVPKEELQAAGKPVEGVTEPPKPDETPLQPDAPAEDIKPILEEGLCALLPGAEGSYTLFDCNGQKQGVIPGGGVDLTGVYRTDEIVAGHRMSDGSPVLPQVSLETEWVRDSVGFSVYDRRVELLYRLDFDGRLLFFCQAPAAAEQVTLLPFGRNFLVSIWSGCGTDADPWRQMAPCVLLNENGQVVRDLSAWITTPVRGVLGSELLLLASPDSNLTDAYDLEGNCLGQGLQPLPEVGQSPALGGVLCEYVWQDGWICSAGLQPQQACPDLQTLQLCGDHISGIVYDIDGIPSNGQLLICGEEAAVWGVDRDVLAIQWQGINYHFDAGGWAHQQLQRCSTKLAVSYAWDNGGRAAFRLLFLDSGAILEYNCPAGAKASALLGDGYALFATAQTDLATKQQICRFWVVDASGALRQESDSPLMPCAIGPYLLRREEAGVSLLDLDGKALLSAFAS